MKKSLALISAFMLLIPHASIGQMGILKGKVSDSNGYPLLFATIDIDGTSFSTISDENGYYELNLKAGKYDLSCIATGYIVTYVRGVIISSGKIFLLDLELEELYPIVETVAINTGGKLPSQIKTMTYKSGYFKIPVPGKKTNKAWKH